MSELTVIHVQFPVTNCEIVSAPEIDYGVTPEFDYGPTPQYGWDNAVDIEEGKRVCRDMAGGPLNNAQGRKIIFDLAMRLRALGISKPLAADLIDRYCTSTVPKGDV